MTLTRAARFLGRRVIALLACGLAVGLALSVVEIAFAFSLQAFLLRLGVMGSAAAGLPAWVSALSLHRVLAAILAIGVGRAALYWAQIYLQGASQDELRFLHRKKLLTWTYHSGSASAADIVNLFNARVEAASMAVFSLQSLATQLTSAVLLGFNLLWMAPKLTLLLGAALLVLVPPLKWADRRTKSAGESLNAEWERLGRRLMAGVKNLLLLQIYGTAGLEESFARKNLDAHHRHVIDFYRVLGFQVALPQALGVLLICVVALGRGQALPAPGLLVTYLYLFLRLVQLFSSSNQAVSTFAVNWPQARVLMQWFESQSPAAAPVVLAAEPFVEPVGWRLSGVRFGFPEASGPVFDGFDLAIKPGSFTVLIGPSGCGKSTLIALLLGVISPQSGAVELIDGATTAALDTLRPRLLRSVGYVGPESFLIEGTLRDNLLYGLGREPSAAEIELALSQAECSFVSSLPLGLAHQLTEQGQGLSAGQKQRLSLARALLRRPTVLILDEATANLDSATEARLIETLGRFKGRMTIVAATHREALLTLADQVVRLGS